MLAAFYSIKLCSKALQCERLYEKENKGEYFVEVLDELICGNIHVYMNKQSRAPFIELFCYSGTAIEVSEKIVTSNKSFKEELFWFLLPAK